MTSTLHVFARVWDYLNNKKKKTRIINSLCWGVCQVVMLSSVTELHAYIDPGQLTTELGGTQEYCHDSWISHRTVRTPTIFFFFFIRTMHPFQMYKFLDIPHRPLRLSPSW